MTKAFESKCCTTPIPINDFVKSISVYWSAQNWLLYKCPQCNKQSHLIINNELVEFGYLDGASGPCFIPEYSQRIPNLKYNKTTKQALISFGNLQNKLKAK